MESVIVKNKPMRNFLRITVLLPAAWLCLIAVSGCTGMEPETASVRKTESGSGNSGEKTTVFFKPYIGYPESKAADNSVRNIIISVYESGSLIETLNLDTDIDASMEVETGKTYAYYACANIANVEMPASEEEVRAMRVSVSPKEPSGGFPMAAMGEFSVSGEDNTVTVMLERLYSKLRFKVDFSDLPDLEITSVKIRQAASSVTLFSESKAILTTDGDSATSAEISALNAGGEIELYLPENCQGTLLPDNNDSAQKIPENIPGKSGVCSYIEVAGKFSGELEFNGEIVYRFYTGNDETSDFNVVRNTDNLVTMTPLRKSIASPSWQVDAEDVYANVPVIVAGMYTHYYYVNKGNISSGSIVRGSSAHMKRIIRGNNCYIGIAGYSGVGSDTSDDFGIIARSVDGKSWITIKNVPYDLQDIAYGNGTFVVTTDTETILVSPGGQIWTEIQMSEEIEEVFFGNGIFIATGTYACWKSTDGVTWTGAQTDLIFPTVGTYGNGEYVITSSYLYTAKSKDGITWTKYTNSFDSTAYPAADMIYGNGVYLLTTGRQLFRSTDGYNWKAVQSLSSYLTATVDYKDGVLAAHVSKGIDGRQYYFVMTSLDGEKWTEIYRSLNHTSVVCIL